MRRLLALTALVCLTGAEVARAAWAPPVPGPPARVFDLGADPFAAGQHRGVDLAAARGEPVRAACGGVVRFAGRVAGAGTVSVSCGAWRVSYAPLERILVRAGVPVRAGRRLGSVARPRGHAGRAGTRPAGHTGLHLGVRREGRRFGYVDPLRFLATARRAPPPLVVPARPRPAARPHPAPRPVRPTPAPAPWPVWLGLALLLAGFAGAGTVRLPRPSTGGAACRASSTSSSSPTTPSSP